MKPLFLLLISGWALSAAAAEDTINVQNRRELFVDHHVIETMDNVRLELAKPQNAGVAMRFDQPWEYAAGFVSVIKDGDLYRMYYRGGSRNAKGKYDSKAEVTCYAESPDGITWKKPSLGLHSFRDNKDTNIILSATGDHVSHNFAPILDNRPGVPPEERYKAVGGKGPGGKPSIGLFRYVSADGIHWKPYSKDPLFAGYALDSLNVLAWLPEEQCYAIYLRTWSEGGVPSQPKFKGFRTISRSTSKDFVTWTEPTPMTFGDTPMEHLYTNNTQPYFRAPHILISMPFRFWPSRQIFSDEQQAAWGVSSAQAKGLTDAVFMTSRGGNRYDRTFMESFIRPGTDPLTWHARETQPSLGVVPINKDEMSFYVINHYTLPTAYLSRYALRTDGFASAHAGYTPGTLLTKPLRFRGGKLILNLATSAAGSVKVELLDEKNTVIATSEELIGNEIERVVTWKDNFDLSKWAGQDVRLKLTLQDSDVFAFQFTE